MSWYWNSSRNEKIAMNSRISTGPMVQSTSTVVLWVNLAGCGLALAL